MRTRSLLVVVVAVAALAGALLSANLPRKTTEAATATPAPAAGTAKATFAGGCFWCMVPPFDRLDGVLSVTSGYTGGNVPNPDYEQVSTGKTGHAEAVEIVFDPARISYQQLLDIFWANIDPLTDEAQFCDAGNQYRTAIFYHDETQRQLAEATKEAEAAKLKAPVVTEIVAAGPFYPAEDYHQDFYKKEREHYRLYRAACGRDRRLKKLRERAAANAEGAHTKGSSPDN
jgi:peptide-methionine (S)-S-oxide reductase